MPSPCPRGKASYALRCPPLLIMNRALPLRLILMSKSLTGYGKQGEAHQARQPPQIESFFSTSGFRAGIQIFELLKRYLAPVEVVHKLSLLPQVDE